MTLGGRWPSASPGLSRNVPTESKLRSHQADVALAVEPGPQGGHPFLKELELLPGGVTGRQVGLSEVVALPGDRDDLESPNPPGRERDAHDFVD